MFTDYFYHLRCDIMNWIICHAMRHCGLYAGTIYDMLRKVHPDRIRMMVDEIEKEKIKNKDLTN